MCSDNAPQKFGYNNSKRYFVTAKQVVRLGDLLHHELGQSCDTAKVILSGGVWLGKARITDPNFELAAGDTVKVYATASQGLAYTITPEQIILEDDNILVVNKPAGLTSVPDRSNLKHNLTYAVSQYLGSQGVAYSPAPITRLDYMVGGLTLFGKNKKTVGQLTNEMKARRIHKLYRATMPDTGNLPACLRVKNKLDFVHRAIESPQGRNAHSLFIRQPNKDGLAVYSVILYTGRRHQIRAHAAQYLAPLVGDDLYGPKYDGLPQTIGLVAAGLNFWLGKTRYRLRL